MNGRADMLDWHDSSCPKWHLAECASESLKYEQEFIRIMVRVFISQTGVYFHLFFLCCHSADLSCFFFLHTDASENRDVTWGSVGENLREDSIVCLHANSFSSNHLQQVCL